MTLTIRQGEELVVLARRALEAFVAGGKVPGAGTDGFLQERRGVFVTLSSVGPEGGLRGCIGFPYPHKPLGEAVVEATVAAAAEDPRFTPVTETELSSILVEVSALTVPMPMEPGPARKRPSKVRIGVDGLIVARGYSSGLLLPQVATEFGMDQEEFISQACLKAGLRSDAWLDDSTEVLVFQAEVFAESAPRGQVAHRA